MATIVTGYIDNPEGQRALELAIGEARRREAKLIVVHSMRGGADTSSEDVLRYRSALELVGERLTKEGLSHEVVEYVRDNTPAEDLLAAAAEFDAELLVIGYRKRSAAGKAILGSHAQTLLMGAECPVLAIMAPAES
ncbi:MAG: universal stress protein [Acidimicrobiia bacterium]|nr:universal stress protein [Acidimicrobiia bacterium]